jgi:hypothetical protein
VTYQGLVVVEELDGFLDVSIEDRVAYLDSVADALDIECLALEEIGLVRKLFSCARVAFGDEVVHDDRVDVTNVGVSVCIFMRVYTALSSSQRQAMLSEV